MRAMMRRSLVVFAIGVCTLAATRGASAEPTAQELSTARALFNEGARLRAEGDVAGALERLKAAYALVPTPIIGLELGQALLQTGKLVEARETCYAASRLPPSSGESSAGAAARQDAARLAEDLRPRIPALRIEVTGAPPGEPLRVTLDGE